MNINIQGKPLKEWVEEQKKSDDFPLFCYFVQRGTNNWRTINGAKYNANPEERKGIIRKVPRY